MKSLAQNSSFGELALEPTDAALAAHANRQHSYVGPNDREATFGQEIDRLSRVEKPEIGLPAADS
jgi:hypothetical protein